MLEVATDIYHRPLSHLLREVAHFDEFTEVLELRRIQREEREADQRAASQTPPD